MMKQYIKPQTEVMEIEYRGMLALSGDLDGIPSGPAHSRELEDLFNMGNIEIEDISDLQEFMFGF